MAMITAEKPKEKYERTRLDNAINTAILAWTAPICVTWTASKYAKNAWRWFTQHPGMIDTTMIEEIIEKYNLYCHI